MLILNVIKNLYTQISIINIHMKTQKKQSKEKKS